MQHPFKRSLVSLPLSLTLMMILSLLSGCDDSNTPSSSLTGGAPLIGGEAAGLDVPLGAVMSSTAGASAGEVAGDVPGEVAGELAGVPNPTGGLEEPEPLPPELAIAFEPERVRFVFQAENTPTQQVTQLVNLSETPVYLSALRLEGSPTFSVRNAPPFPLRLSPREPLLLEVTHSADDQAPDSAQLIAETLEGASATLLLAAETKGAIPSAPCLEVSPLQVFFGSVGRGQTETRDVTLSACSDRPVTVSALNRGVNLFGALPPTFSFTPPNLPLTLNAGERVSFPVSYTPRRAGLEGGFIEVVSDDASTPRQNVNLSAIAEPPPLEEVGLHVKLEWSTDLTDVDLHLIGPNGQVWTCEGDCYFSNGNPNWGDQSTDLDDPFLDRDDVDGYGPENINLEAPASGIYKVWVHYWDAHDGWAPDATVELYSFGALMGRFGPQALNSVDDMWEVAEVEFPGFIVRPINTVSNPQRGSLCGGF